MARPLPQLSDHLSLSKRYTGHCVRVATTQNLCNASIQDPKPSHHDDHWSSSRVIVVVLSLQFEVDGATTSGHVEPARQSCGRQSFSTRAPWPCTSRSFGLYPQSASDAATPSFDLLADLEEDDWDAQMVAAVSTVMDQVEKGRTSLSTGTSKSPSFGQGATFNNCVFHFG